MRGCSTLTLCLRVWPLYSSLFIPTDFKSMADFAAFLNSATAKPDSKAALCVRAG
jgi:hypothetical protein